MARRTRGEGTLYRRKDGRYEASAYLLTTTGVRKRVRFYGTTAAEARAKRDDAEHNVKQGIPVPDHQWRLGDYLDYWLENIVRRNQRRTTYMRYESCVRLHLKPSLGQAHLSRLSVPQVQQFFALQLDTGKSLRTVQIMREVLRSALTNAMREELLVRNVAARTTLQKRERRLDIEPWSVDESKAFLAAAETDPYYAAYLMLVIYGLRRGEVAGLRWGDVDFTARKLRIRQQLQRIGKAVAAGPLKTKAGRRNLALVGLVAAPLLAMKPADTQEDDLVFHNSVGGPLEPQQLYKHFNLLCQKHGLRRIRLHDLRHSQATLLKKLGVQPRDAQLILGHASVQTTQEIYQHEDEESQRETLQRVERLFLRSGVGRHCRQRWSSKGGFEVTLPGSDMAGDEGFELALTRLRHPVNGPVTEVMLVLRDRARLWLLGRIAVKFGRQILPPPNARNPHDLWSFSTAWLNEPTEEAPCNAQ